jgi:hypothetical protein
MRAWRPSNGKTVLPNKNVKAPFNVRPVVWLVVLGVVIGSAILPGLSSRRTKKMIPHSPTETLSHQEASTPGTGFRRIPRAKIAPVASEQEAGGDLDESQLAMIEQMIQDRRTWMDDSRSTGF